MVIVAVYSIRNISKMTTATNNLTSNFSIRSLLSDESVPKINNKQKKSVEKKIKYL
jgi:hypothetical protein